MNLFRSTLFALVGALVLSITSCSSDSDTGSESSGGECSPTTETCSVNGDCCDFPDALCVTFSDIGTRCTATCRYNSDCAGNCCGETEDGQGICVPSDRCR